MKNTIHHNIKQYNSEFELIDRILQNNEEVISGGKLDQNLQSIKEHLGPIVCAESMNEVEKLLEEYNLKTCPDKGETIEGSNFSQRLRLLQTNPLEGLNLCEEQILGIALFWQRDILRSQLVDPKESNLVFHTNNGLLRDYEGMSEEEKSENENIRFYKALGKISMSFKQGRTYKDAEYFGYRNLHKLGVIKSRHTSHDSHYSYHSIEYYDVIFKKLLSLVSEPLKTRIRQLLEKQNEQGKKFKIKKEQQKFSNEISKEFTNLGKNDMLNFIQTQMPELYTYLSKSKSLSGISHSLSIDQDEKLACFVTQHSQINGTGAMTYWIETNIRHDGEIKSFRHIYRDPSNIHNEDWSRGSPTTTITDIKKNQDTLICTVKTTNTHQTKHFSNTAHFSTGQTQLSKQEQEKFEELFTTLSEELRQSQRRENGVERDLQTNSFKHREEPIIKSSHINLKSGIGAIIIQAQIDSGIITHNNQNKQYGFYGYIIELDKEPRLVRSQTGRERQLGWIDLELGQANQQLVKEISNTSAKSLLDKNT